jgi:RNA polymerase sigma factor (sigma-70 family)
MWMRVAARLSDHDDDSKDFPPELIRLHLDGDAYTYARAQAALVVRGYNIPASEQADIVQTVLAQACKAMSKPDFGFQKNPGVFIRTLAHRACINWWRKHHPNVPFEIDRPSLSPSPEDKFHANERALLATHILNQLAPTCRQLIQKHIFEGLSYAEIAALTGRSEGALRVEMCKCLKRAKEIARRLLKRPDPRNGGEKGDR